METREKREASKQFVARVCIAIANGKKGQTDPGGTEMEQSPGHGTRSPG